MLYTMDSLQMSLLDAYIELSALQALNATAADEPPLLPKLIASSHAWPQDIWEEALSGGLDLDCPPIDRLPWVVLELCPGKALVPSKVGPEYARALGMAVARLHNSAKGRIFSLLFKTSSGRLSACCLIKEESFHWQTQSCSSHTYPNLTPTCQLSSTETTCQIIKKICGPAI